MNKPMPARKNLRRPTPARKNPPTEMQKQAAVALEIATVVNGLEGLDEVTEWDIRLICKC